MVAFRPLTAADIPQVTRLNNDAYPAVPRTTAHEMGSFVQLCNWSVGVELGGSLVGFLLALEPGVDYDSENYIFFESRGLPHFYIDRVVLGAGSRGKGIGSKLYAEVFAEATRRGYSRITCEVNLKPANPASIAFHEAMGFIGVGVHDTKAGHVTVQLFEAIVAGDGSHA